MKEKIENEDNIMNEANFSNDINMLDTSELLKISSYKDCVVKIIITNKYYKKEGTGSGFFCKLPINHTFLSVLLTNNHVLNEEFLNNRKELIVEYKEKKKILDLRNRYKYQKRKK